MAGKPLSTKGYLGSGAPIAPAPPSPEIAKNLFRRSEKWVNSVRNLVGLINITLIRGAGSRATVATPDMTVFKYMNRRGHMVRTEVRDFIINIEDYKTGATLLTPKEGDIIEEIEGAIKYRHKVLPTNKEPVFILTGAYRTAFRVHTKLIEEVTI